MVRGLTARAIGAAMLAAVAIVACQPPPDAVPPPPARVPLVGYLSVAPRATLDNPRDADGLPGRDPLLRAFRAGLAELGYEEGKNLRVDYRFLVEGDGQILSDVAADLVASRPDVIVAIGMARVQAVKDATSVIPIVMGAVNDPVQNGLVKQLTPRDDNLTGVVELLFSTARLRLQLFKLAVPGLRQVTVMSPPDWAVAGSPRSRTWAAVQEAAATEGLDVQIISAGGEPTPAATDASIEWAIASAADSGAQGLYILPDGSYDTRRAKITELALRYGLPTAYYRTDFAEDGGLLTVGSNVTQVHRRVAAIVHQALNGVPVRNLPIEQPTHWDIAVNLRTAAALGIDVSPDLLARATDVFR